MTLYSLKIAKNKTNNIIFNSPHSGELFPDDFRNITQVDEHTLLCSGDSYVNDLFSKADNSGSNLLSNNYARSFMDTNREAYELDPSMLSGNITEPLNYHSQKVKMGFGSIAKYGYTRKNIYEGKIPFDEVQKRLKEYYFPIHEKLSFLLNEEFDKYGYSLLVDCHSMPSYEFLGYSQETYKQPDIILGNLFDKSCHPKITEHLTNYFQKHDLTVSHNAPFAGGYNTSHYSAPDKNKHAIQIEIKRSLYMNEKTRTQNRKFNTLKSIMTTCSLDLNDYIKDLAFD